MFSDIYRNSTEKTRKYVKELSLSFPKLKTELKNSYWFIFGSPSGEPMFSLCRKWRNLLDIAKSHDATLDNKLFGSQLKILMKQNCFLFQRTSCHFFSQGLGINCTRLHLIGT